MNLEKRLVDIEVFLANQERILDDLNAEVLRLSRLLSLLDQKIEALKDRSAEALVKPLSEETPPPHY